MLNAAMTTETASDSPETSSADTGEPRTPVHLFALKDGDTFVVCDGYGDITGQGDGLFSNDTRVLSRYRLLIGGHPPALLSAGVGHDNVCFISHGTNRPLPPPGDRTPIPQGVIHLERTRFLWGQRLFERILLNNYGDAVTAPVSLMFDADFRDMFEVRGAVRTQRGQQFAPQVQNGRVEMRYVGLDAVERTTTIAFSHEPDSLTAGRADFSLPMASGEQVEIYVEIAPEAGPGPSRARFRAAAARAKASMRNRRRSGARISSTGRLFNAWLNRSRADLALLTTELDTGPYPYAGIPWFSTAFGRDAIITALQMLWLDPALARGVLRYLALHQATQVSDFQDAAPGKIMHETRRGEMTAVGELPFGRYYGGVDTTPLFVVLAGAYAERTADMAFIDEIWPALEAAMAWVEGLGDSNGDGLLDYARAEDTGLSNQGWKDSEDSIFHADGRFPVGPIALVEVQGYVHAAAAAMAQISRQRGDSAGAEHWRARSEAVRQAVEARYWMEDERNYGVAVDGAGELCRVRASNVGHLLYVGLPSPERAAEVTRQLLSGAFNTGWGLRTLASGQARFNPMAYHNGSVWPHDTALCAAGLARYGERAGVVKLLSELFETASNFEMRLPELFCGFPRITGQPPVGYPVACIPQAWAAGSVFMMLQACLGLTIDAARGEIRVERPHLPIGIDQLTLRGLQVGDRTTDIVFKTMGGRVVAFTEGDSTLRLIELL